MIDLFFQLLGGLGMFLFGMKILSEGLQKVSGKKMRHILTLVTSNRFIGCGVGTIVTGIIQSSSATTVMLVSFVDSGLMNLTQAVSVILGANIGTTVTAQLIAFQVTAYALPSIGAGAILKFFSGQGKRVYIGEVLLGFGLVFYGLATMKSGFSLFRDDPAFISLFTKFNAETFSGMILCVLSGALLTMILQSSSATVGITMALASQGLINIETSISLIMGENIGTTITAQLASIGFNVNARRTANAHSLFNVIGVLIIIAFFPFFLRLVIFVTSEIMMSGPPDLIVNGENQNISRYIANSHSMFNIINALIFLFALPYLIKVTIWLTPHKIKETDLLDDFYHIKYINTKYIDSPSVAIAKARLELSRMGELVQVMFRKVVYSIHERQVNELAKWRKKEDIIDLRQKELTQFLVKVTQSSISPEESTEVRSLLRIVNNLERIGDAVEDIASSLEKYFEQNLFFSDEGIRDYLKISNEAEMFIDLVLESMKNEDKEIISNASENRIKIQKMDDEMKVQHLTRLQKEICGVDQGMIFVNIMTAFERISNSCYNIAQAVSGSK
ncbi:MAG: Na/Pi cotransporter family protein [Deltaproteobacteria bacterium]|nr:Na/Pi cotransporter family protein [Deltaproteobacteria bacterium]